MTFDWKAGVIKGTYCHSKSGRLYEVIGVALQTESNEQLVVYKPLYKSEREFYARPYEMFFDEVEVGGKTMNRFEKVEDKA